MSRREVAAWTSMRERLLDNTKLDASWEMLDRYTAKVDEQIDLLVNYTAGDGFLYRQSARATVARDSNLNMAGTALAIALSALVAWALARRIVRPVAVASEVAERIAAGKLDVVIPRGSADELGALLASMGMMRDNIRAMMEREVTQRRTAQARLADALESSQEGVVVVDSDDCIALANPQAADFLGVSPDLLKPGTPLADLHPAFEDPVSAGRVLSWRDGDPQATGEVLLADGRWLRISHSATRDQGFIVVCSDITLSKKQEASLRQTNWRLDAALDNMSQGLCLFDAQQRLEVVNRRFFEIFGLPRDKIQPGSTFREILELKVASQNHGGKTAEQLVEELTDALRRHTRGIAFLRAEVRTGDRLHLQYDGGRRLGRDLRRRDRTAEGRSQDHAHGASRRAHQSAEPAAVPREDGAGAQPRRTARHPVHRSRPLQERQRYAGASGRRRACCARSPSACRWRCAAPIRSPASAATSSPSSRSARGRPTPPSLPAASSSRCRNPSTSSATRS